MPISDLIAAQLSFAAYTPLANYQSGTITLNGVATPLSNMQYRDDTATASPVLRSLPAGWHVETGLSDKDGSGDNQFIVFKNDSTNQIVIAFKGTNTLSQGMSDVLNSGFLAWDGLRAAAASKLAQIKATFPTAEIMTDGHSLGGGMAQTFALENDLSGYGQNSLPIPELAKTSTLDFANGSFAGKLAAYQNSSTLSFSEVNTYGDPATLYYSFLNGNAYLDTTPQALTNVYGPSEVLAAGVFAVNPGLGAAALVGAGYSAHIIQTVIASLQAGAATTSQATVTASQADASHSAVQATSSIVNQNGSVVLTQTDGKVFTITQLSSATALTALNARPSGQSYLYDIASNTGVTISGTSLAGHETATVYDSATSTTIVFDQNSSSGAGTLKLADSTVLSITGAGSARVASINGSEQGLVDFLTQVGGPSTAAQLHQVHLTQVKPAAATLYEFGQLTSTRGDGSVDVDYYVTGLTGSQATGGAVTGSVAPNLTVSGNPQQHATLDIDKTVDFTGASISGFERLTTQTNGKAILTAAQLASFQTISSIAISTTSGGTYSLAGKNVNGVSLTAQSWDGTTLIGNGSSDLIASLFGNDTLQAGDGGSHLSAGYGVDTITGGAGSDYINLLAGRLAAGSSINGGAGSDNLVAGGSTSDTLDISQGSVANIETLASQNVGSVVLNTSELAGFANVQTTTSAGVMITGSNAGTYDLSAKSLSGIVNLTGSSGNDLLVGGSTSKKIYGGAGDDRIVYGSALTTIDGGIGSDTLVFGSTAPSTINLANGTVGSAAVIGIESVDAQNATNAITITGDANGNTLKGGSGADTLLGGDGDDIITYDAADTLEDGGPGTDTLVLNQTVATTANLANTSDQVAGGGTTINFENLDGSGSTAALNLTGDSNANTIKGGSAADTLSGGAGNDTISYDALDVSTDGGAGSDTIVLTGATAITANLSNASDQVTGGGTTTGFENIDGSVATAALTLTGDAGANILSGGTGNDTIVGGGGADSIFGNDGDDVISYDAAALKIDGGAGDDTLIVAQGTVFDVNNQTNQVTGSTIVTGFEHIVVASGGVNIINGDAGANTLNGTAGVDRIDGLGGADTIYGNGGDDAIVYDTADVIADGGAGNDTLVVSQSAATTINLSNAADQVSGDTGTTTGFENVDGTGSSADLTITGDAGANIIKGGAGNDILYGTAGGDQRYGNAGDDIILYTAADSITDGGNGNDTLYFRQPEATIINLANAADQVLGGGVTTGFENVDAYELSTAVTITGDGGDNTIFGGTGNDVINGNGGYDYISAGGGDDTVTYNDGAQAIYGDVGNDTLVLNRSVATTVDLSSTFAGQVIGGAAAFGFESADASASTAAMTLTGDTGTNVLKGGNAADTINGGAGADSLYGNAGNDTIAYDAADLLADGGSGIDTLLVNQATATVIDLANIADQVSSDTGTTTGFENIDGSSSTGNLTVASTSLSDISACETNRVT